MKKIGAIAKRGLRGLGIMMLAWLVTTSVTVLLLRWIDPPISSFMLRDRVNAWLDNDKTYHFDHQWVDFAHIAKPLKLAVIASEDQKFSEHFGFDFESMQHAWDHNQHGRKVKGASTISQQVAKNLFLWPGRSLFRKAVEAYFTVLLETFCSKQRILEIYLNSAEFGKGKFGAEAAAKYFFHKPASQLNTSEAALFAAVLPAPKRLTINRPSNYLRNRQNWIEGQMAHMEIDGLLGP